MMMIMMITCVSEILSNTVAVYETAAMELERVKRVNM